ncbi:MAG: hypothetical protein D6732_01025 [Methanobacteriota archaeon]|nr:MAG: hypothetical protein D6732_01025 [Euryarchaeota archaeon]
MPLTHMIIRYPRYKIDVSELRTFWNSPILNSYMSICKLGLDQDATTLAVNTYFDLIDTVGTKPDVLYLCSNGELDRAVFLEATGLIPEEVKFYQYGEMNALLTIKETCSNVGAAFLVVDVPKGKDDGTDVYCSGAAVGGYSGEERGLELVETTDLPPLMGMETRLDGRVFSPSVENALIDSITAISKDEGKLFANVANLKAASRKIKNFESEGSKRFGFAGIATGLSSFIYFIENSFTPDQNLTLVAVEEAGGIAMHFRGKNPPPVVKSIPTFNLDGAGFLMRRGMPQGNVSIPQGAYISTPIYFAEKEARYRLRSAICDNCGLVHFPPRRICKDCGSPTKPSDPLPRRGRLYTFTQILKGAAPTEFDLQQRLEGEYCVGIIEFETGPRVISQLTDVNIQDLNIGDEMKMVFRKIYHQDGMDRYGYKFTKLT